MKHTTKIIFAILGTILVVGFIIILALTGRVPRATDKALTEAFASAEQRINLVQPGYTNEVLDPATMKSFLSDSKQLAAYLQTDERASAAVDVVGAETIVKLFEETAKGLDNHLDYFSQNNVPLTIHNVFDYVKTQSEAPVKLMTKGLYIIEIVVFFVAVIVLMIMFFIMKKGEENPEQGVTFGNDATTQF